MSKDSGSNSVVQKNISEPAAYAKPGLERMASEALRLYNAGTGPTYHSGYVGPNADELSGLSQLRGLAGQNTGLGSGLLGNIKGPLQDIISGRNGISITEPGAANPYIMGALDTSAAKAKHLLDTSYGGSGRYMSPEYGAGVTREIGDIYSRGLSNQVNLDLDRKAAGQAANISNVAGATSEYGALAPGVDPLRYAGAQKLVDVGGASRAEEQARLADINAGKTAAETRPWDLLSFLNQTVAGVSPYGGTQTTMQPKGSPIAGALGGAASGAGIGGLLGASNPLLALLAAGGGLLGAFG